ncbi:UMTA methyltransferase family protein [Xylaria bambusicola]|uniref:UMTA methyltransferase family protein n=1 Tax=Xylaria bambusicola TaxID=326684 RepID=UPI0020081ED9|nr:UMTA methyltransferase family protein [Xylaria bambusicola]KAI0521231.1 UMTA methyltransferase family protein [Xylaria bambusicola]
MASKDDYVLTRDIFDNTRLNLIHHLWTRSSGYVIHPAIPIKDTDLRVADIGAGTGVWLCDVSERLPKTAQLYGLDISFDAMPPLEILPPNISLRIWDIRTPVHEELVEFFDIIHIRFFIFVLRENEVSSAVAKLMKMLKPGGYLQWVDSEHTSLRFEKTKPENSTENMSQLMSLLESQNTRLEPTWVPALPKIFTENGLVGVELDKQSTPRHHAYMMHESGLMIHELIARKTKNEEMAKEIKQLLPLAIDETRKGAYLTTDRYTVIGKKPE